MTDLLIVLLFVAYIIGVAMGRRFERSQHVCPELQYHPIPRTCKEQPVVMIPNRVAVSTQLWVICRECGFSEEIGYCPTAGQIWSATDRHARRILNERI